MTTILVLSLTLKNIVTFSNAQSVKLRSNKKTALIDTRNLARVNERNISWKCVQKSSKLLKHLEEIVIRVHPEDSHFSVFACVDFEIFLLKKTCLQVVKNFRMKSATFGCQ